MSSRSPLAHWGRLTQAERDAAYNNSAAVPGSQGLNEARIAASASLRAGFTVGLDLAYGDRDRQKWDLYPSPNPHAPCFVFIHGGYWQRNRREEFAILGAGVRAHGWSFALPGYTLAPDATLTEIVDEIVGALDWLARDGARHGVAGPILVSGWSAGGHLAALALNHPAVSAGLAISGVYELGPLRDTYLNAALRLRDQEIEALSPLRLPPVDKPLDIAYGTRELPALIDDSRNLHGMRAAGHCPGALHPVAGCDHFTILDALSSPTGVLTKAALALLG